MACFLIREEARHIFQKLFVPALSLVMETLENYLFHCFDAVGLLLMIHMTYAHRRVMQQRRVPVLDTYFDRVNMLLWPRIKVASPALVHRASVWLQTPLTVLWLLLAGCA